MQFSLNTSTEILERTPRSIYDLLNGLSDDWIINNEGGETWSAFDIVKHLVHSEKTNWIPRIEIVLSEKTDKHFKPFDMAAQFEIAQGNSLQQLLEEFIAVRNTNLEKLKRLNITDKDFSKTGIHPALGTVTLAQLISTWVVHDLNHTAQLTRVMAKQYKDEVGPWIQYLRILKLS